ncbi:hypothetical protein C5706_33035, partial [Klebsiella pneumoniae]
LAQVIHLANSDWPAARWWEAYDDPQLNMLINRAIVNPQQAQLAQVIHLANSDWPAARWWEAYDDPQLNMLINRA